MIKRLSGKKLSSWLKLSTQRYINASESFDIIGEYRLSENLYKSVLGMSSLIRLSEDENEEDVDFVVLDEKQVNEEDFDFSSFIQPKLDDDILDHEYDYKSDLIPKILEILRSSGRNVFNCLNNIAKYLEEERTSGEFSNNFTFDHYLPKYRLSIRNAFDWYFRNPLFSVYDLDIETLLGDLFDNNVSVDTVALFDKIQQKNETRKTDLIVVRDEIRRLLAINLPGYENDNFLIKYFSSNFMSGEFYLYDLKNFDLEAYEKYKEIFRLKSDAYKTVESFDYVIKFLKSKPSKLIFDYFVKNFERVHRGEVGYIYSNIIELNLYDYQTFILNSDHYQKLIEKLINLDKSKIKYKYFDFGKFNNLELIMSQDEALNIIFNRPSVGGTTSEFIGYLNDNENINLFRRASEEYPNKTIYYSECFASLGFAKYGQQGKEVFIWLKESLFASRDYFSDLVDFMMPVYIKYFYPAVNGDLSRVEDAIRIGYRHANLFTEFNKFYSLVGEKIYDYNLSEIYSISNCYSLELDQKSGHIGLKEYEVIKSKNGNHPNFDVWKSIYFRYPFAHNLSLDQIIGLYVSPEESDLRINQSYEEIDFTSPENLRKLKELALGFSPSASNVAAFYKLFSADITDENREFLKLVFTSENIIGNVEKISKDAILHKNYPDLSFTELHFGKFKDNEYLLDFRKVKKIQDFMLKRYPNVIRGSEKYNKIFAILSNNYEVRGADPDLLDKMFDASIVGKHYLALSSINLYAATSAMGQNDLSNLSQENIVEIFSVQLKIPETEEILCRRTFKLKPEWIINIGGFEKFFSMSDSELVAFLNSHRIIDEREIQEIRSQRGLYSQTRDKYSTFLLKCNKNILKNKLIVLLFKEYFKINQIDINEKGNSFNRANYTLKSFTEKFQKEMMEAYFCGVKCESKLKEVYGMEISLFPLIIPPQSMVSSTYSSLDTNSEELTNLGKIVQVFRKSTSLMLDLYAKEECKNAGYPVRGFDAVPSIRLKNKIIHDLGNLLPDNLPSKQLNGYAQYFMNNFLQDKNNDLKKIGNMWNSVLNLYDKKNNVINTGTVESFSKILSIVELSEQITINSFIAVINELNPQDRNFAFSFARNMGLSDKTGNVSSDDKILYTGLEKIYLDGLSVEMPSWSSFTSTVDNMTLRFLPREDTRGMFLGNITNCCQHPKGYAASCAYDGHLNPLACFAIFEKENKIIFQSYVWSDTEGNVCFDSIETSNRDHYNDDNLVRPAIVLMMEFSASIEGKCTVGSNKLGFNSSTERILNPSVTHHTSIVNDLLNRFSPSRDRFYSTDSQRQNIVKKM